MPNNDNYVTPLEVVKNTDTIFSSVIKEGFKYEIPLYQRAFAWTEKEIRQLMEDIFDYKGEHYFIGSLIVAKKDGIFEVIDGQQRLTSLFIILNCINWYKNQILNNKEPDLNIPSSLVFSCRDKSNYSLENIEAIINSNSKIKDEKRIAEEIQNGVDIVKSILNSKTIIKKFDFNVFRKNIEKLILFRIEVPENTDLNHYFEIMNTRGEQLEQPDILKSILMNYLPKSYVNNDREIFAKIWEAISDMNGYIQRHFDYLQKEENSETQETKISNREILFSENWDTIPPKEWDEYKKLKFKNIFDENGLTMEDIIKIKNFKIIEEDEVEDERVRFESIIDFSHFLLHALRVFSFIFEISLPEPNKIGLQLDDKRLLPEFKYVFENGKIPNFKGTDVELREYLSKNFIMLLLRLRYLYDKYIVKREYVFNKQNNFQDEEGEWNLQKVQFSITNKGYKNIKYEKTFSTENANNVVLMIQAAMRVSYTSPKVMHWITEVLKFLVSENFTEQQLAVFCEDYVKKAVNKNFLNIYTRELPLGVNTPHIVFNYLDYLLWKENKEKYKDFMFEFRTSVEHFYPQHPSEESFKQWKERNSINTVDVFGNLCLLQRNINSKFSNLSPTSKIGSYEDAIAKGSLKLQLMVDWINKYKKQTNDSEANKRWAEKDGGAFEHENQMIEKLRNSCNNITYKNEIQD